jgi:hypothetical protein
VRAPSEGPNPCRKIAASGATGALDPPPRFASRPITVPSLPAYDTTDTTGGGGAWSTLHPASSATSSCRHQEVSLTWIHAGPCGVHTEGADSSGKPVAMAQIKAAAVAALASALGKDKAPAPPADTPVRHLPGCGLAT